MENLSNGPAAQAGGVGSSSSFSSTHNTAKVPDDYVDPEDARWAEETRVREARKEWARKLKMREEDIQIFLDNGYSPEGLEPHCLKSRQSMLAYLKKRSGPIPKWVAISGLWNETDKTVTITEESRTKRLKVLYKTVVLLVKRALGRHEVDPDKGDRSVFWDPVAMVARELEIPPSKLSALLKEYCGHSLTQVMDNVRAERLKGKLRSGVRGFLKGRGVGVNGLKARSTNDGAARGECVGMEAEVWAVWGELKESRRWPEFSRNIWANELGFASYRRLYRACVSVYGRTPFQLEMMIIREELSETAKEEGGSEKEEVVDWVGDGLKGIERAVLEIGGYREEDEG